MFSVYNRLPGNHPYRLSPKKPLSMAEGSAPREGIERKLTSKDKILSTNRDSAGVLPPLYHDGPLEGNPSPPQVMFQNKDSASVISSGVQEIILPIKEANDIRSYELQGIILLEGGDCYSCLLQKITGEKYTGLAVIASPVEGKAEQNKEIVFVAKHWFGELPTTLGENSKRTPSLEEFLDENRDWLRSIVILNYINKEEKKIFTLNFSPLPVERKKEIFLSEILSWGNPKGRKEIPRVNQESIHLSEGLTVYTIISSFVEGNLSNIITSPYFRDVTPQNILLSRSSPVETVETQGTIDIEGMEGKSSREDFSLFVGELNRIPPENLLPLWGKILSSPEHLDVERVSLIPESKPQVISVDHGAIPEKKIMCSSELISNIISSYDEINSMTVEGVKSRKLNGKEISLAISSHGRLLEPLRNLQIASSEEEPTVVSDPSGNYSLPSRIPERKKRWEVSRIKSSAKRDELRKIIIQIDSSLEKQEPPVINLLHLHRAFNKSVDLHSERVEIPSTLKDRWGSSAAVIVLSYPEGESVGPKRKRSAKATERIDKEKYKILNIYGSNLENIETKELILCLRYINSLRDTKFSHLQNSIIREISRRENYPLG